MHGTTIPYVNHCQNKVSQAYCSALPVTYYPHSADQWESFACLILEASYEAVICSAIINSVKNKSNKLFLTLIGGGAFGNRTSWITKAIERALTRYQEVDLVVVIVSYGEPDRRISDLLTTFKINKPRL